MDHHEQKEEKHEHVHHEPAHHAETHQASKSKPNSALIFLAVALALLIVVAGVQAVELTKIKKQLEDEKTTLVSSSATKSPTSLQQSLESLPSMVGGC